MHSPGVLQVGAYVCLEFHAGDEAASDCPLEPHNHPRISKRILVGRTRVLGTYLKIELRPRPRPSLEMPGFESTAAELFLSR